MEIYNLVDLTWGGSALFFIGILIFFMKQKVLPSTMISLLAVPVWAAGPETNPDRWVLGEFLLVAFLVLFVLGWFTGIYALLFHTKTDSLVKRVFLYPLLKMIGKGGKRKPLTTEKG